MKLTVRLNWVATEYDKHTCFIGFLNNRVKIHVFAYPYSFKNNELWEQMWGIKFDNDYDIWWDLHDIIINKKFETRKKAQDALEHFVAEKLSKFIAEVTYE